MCRLLGYIGPPIDLASLLVTPPHSLHEQSWAPRSQLHGTINADGWGVGWYDGERDVAARYRSVLPMWSDPHLTTLLPSVRTALAIAAVRSATPPSPTQLTNTPPFATGRWLLAHNGAVEGWGDGVGEQLRRSLPIASAASLEGSTDSEVILALVLAALDAGSAVPDALELAASAVLALAPATLNLLLSDGSTLWAARIGDTLSLLRRDDGGRGATFVASEPFDDDERWCEVPEGVLVTATPDGVDQRPLSIDRRPS